MNLVKKILVIVTLFYTPALLAQGTPTFDLLNWLEKRIDNVSQKLQTANQKINNNLAVQELRTSLDTLERMKKQVERMERQYDALSGNNGYGRYLTGPARLIDPASRPKSDEELIRILRSGSGKTAYQKALLSYQEKYGYVENEQANNFIEQSAKETDEQNGNLYATSVSTSNIAAQRSEAIDKFIDEADDTQTLKEAIDLNNVMMAELIRAVNESLTLQSNQARVDSVKNKVNLEKSKAEESFSEY